MRSTNNKLERIYLTLCQLHHMPESVHRIRRISKDRPRKRTLLSDQNGITTPEDWSKVVVRMFANEPVSQTPTCLSLILLNPVVAILSKSPIHTTRAPLTPP